jgi:hypothetical protein
MPVGRAPADHLIGIDAVHRPVRQQSGSASGRAEEGGFVVIADTGRGQIFIATDRSARPGGDTAKKTDKRGFWKIRTLCPICIVIEPFNL